MDFSRVFSQEYHQDLKQSFQKTKSLVLSGISNPTAKAFFISDFFSKDSDSILWLCQDEEEAIEMYKDLQVWLNSEIFLYSPKNTEKEKLHAFIRWVYSEENYSNIFIFPICFYEEKFPSREILEKHAKRIEVAMNISVVELVNSLIENGYEHSDETVLSPGYYRRSGDTVELRPMGKNENYKLEIEFDVCSNIYVYNPLKREIVSEEKEITLYSAKFPEEQRVMLQHLCKDSILIADELDEVSATMEQALLKVDTPQVSFTSFPRDGQDFFHLRYLSILKFYNLPDFLSDIRGKIKESWKLAIYTKRREELENIFKEESLSYSLDISDDFPLKIIEIPDVDYVPASFQNPDKKLAFITDKEIFSLKKAQKNQSITKMNIDFITSLNIGDYIVHFDHGIGVYMGITQRTIEKITREYLEIHFADNDMLFIPVDQADKVSKYISDEEKDIRLSKLGGGEWKKSMKKARKETEKMAKELLKLYAKRAEAKRESFHSHVDREEEFAKTFPYEETPGQIAAIMDIKKDMEGPRPMDRLICGDVGFGKTEVAIRAAFKAVESGKQVALISPVTILAEQHYFSFKKRMQPFGIRVEMLSRFRSAQEQSVIIEKLKKGDVDIVVGTHRLLQTDIEFLNLGLLVIDEEQRFGVKQKEALKNIRTQVDVLTLTATPIPRTLNLSLNDLRDITTITTPPPGRLPIITEVRRYSDQLIKDAIEKELERDGQVYFLHNRVETIEGIADKLRTLIPNAKFIVAHGQMSSKKLEESILAFKAKEYDVLISSTIIENGIDLSNANTMIINNAERFGLSQLYQLRGRIGRSSRQAYAYLLYHSQKLNLDAKKRLRALIEASELGSGFQIAMRDLEIRGAGEILGSSQHGSMRTVGVQHFLKLLKKTIEDMKKGKNFDSFEEDGPSDIAIELPIDAFIPNDYISDSKEKITVYQKLAAVNSHELLREFYEDVCEEYGKMPQEVENLFKVLRLKLFARTAYVGKILARNIGNTGKEIHLVLSDKCTPNFIMKALDYNKKWFISGNLLKMNLKDLGEFWMEGIIKTLESMSDS
ncbi:transcription-repair coupling factor [Candidatus Peregrinibacteria bacterium]|jgi:transcription-repair coupling factor|nr:transcription-repair coupling factor [Candidatus Peregrinibacteria bacterium]